MNFDAEASMRRLERLSVLGSVAGGVAHELRTPLGAIRNSAYYLSVRGKDLDSDMRAAVRDIESCVAKAERILGEVLDFARDQPPVTARVSAVAALDAALTSVFAELPASEALDLRREVPSVPLEVIADREQIERILANLLRNAVQAMPDGGVLIIRAALRTECVRWEVEDSGVGISPERLPRIFEPLVTSKSRGIGLGLAVVERYAKLNGGRVGAESEPGRGSLFWLELPTSAGDDA